MSTIKRYAMWCAVTHSHELTEQDDGVYVLYSDYAALKAKYDALAQSILAINIKTSLEALQATDAKIESLTMALDASRTHVKELEAERDKLKCVLPEPVKAQLWDKILCVEQVGPTHENDNEYAAYFAGTGESCLESTPEAAIDALGEKSKEKP